MKPVPTIDVNLNKYCDMGIHCRHAGHDPLPIPCPIPRSFTAVVRLGECSCPYGWTYTDDMRAPRPTDHSAICPALPVRVSCSISGKTWEESEVTDPDYPEARDRNPDVEARAQSVLRILRMRWSVVKMVVTGQHVGLDDATAGMSPNLFAQRDAVFTALADMALSEDEARKATEALWRALPETAGWLARHPARDAQTPSALLLAAYVERLVEQVGVIQGGQ